MITLFLKSYRCTTSARVAAILALAFSSVVFPQLTFANTITSASTRLVSNESDSDTGISGQAIQSASSQTFTNVTAHATGQANGQANAAEGLLRAFASAHSSTEPISYNSNVTGAGYGRATWNDSLTIVVGSGLLGHSGYITAKLDLNGMLGGAIGGIPAVYGGETGRNELVRMIGTGMTTTHMIEGWNYWAATYRDSLGVGDYANSNLESILTLHIPVIFGSQATLSYTLDVLAGAFSTSRPGQLQGSWVDSYVDYTLSWGGITGVFDGNGNSVVNYSVTSTSGFDYTRQPGSVPDDTATLVLLGGAVLGLVVLRRRIATRPH